MCCPVILSWVSCPSYPVHLFFYFVVVTLTSHNICCLFHLQKQKEVPSVQLQLSLFCPVVCPGHSIDVLGVLVCLIHHSCPVWSILDLFSFLSYPPALSSRLKVKFHIWSYRPTGTAHAYFKVRAILDKKKYENTVISKIQDSSALNEPKRHLWRKFQQNIRKINFWALMG